MFAIQYYDERAEPARTPMLKFFLLDKPGHPAAFWGGFKLSIIPLVKDFVNVHATADKVTIARERKTAS